VQTSGDRPLTGGGAFAAAELAAVLACSERRYLPERYRDADRATLVEQFTQYKLRAGRR
jgi:hypothetical protein